MGNSNLHTLQTVVYNLEYGRDNGGVSRETLAALLQDIIIARKDDQQFLINLEANINSTEELEDVEFEEVTAQDWLKAKYIDEKITELLNLIGQRLKEFK